MNELVFIVPAMVLITVVLFALSVAAPGENTVQNRLRAYGYNLAERPAGDLSQPFVQRVLLPIGTGLARMVYRLTPAHIVTSTRERLRLARLSVPLGLFLFIRVLVGVGLPGLYLLFMLRGRSTGFLEWIIFAVLIYGGYRLPDIWLSLKLDARRDEITRSLPDALDLIVVCVEAGHGLEAAIAKVVESTKGPLAEEFAQMLGEVSLGRSRRDALKAMSDRSGSSDLQTFVAAILQADQMGVNIAEALRIQADAMRVRRRQRAEELIAKAPVKMIFPLAAFIFPALFVVLLGPALMKIFSMFTTMGGR